MGDSRGSIWGAAGGLVAESEAGKMGRQGGENSYTRLRINSFRGVGGGWGHACSWSHLQLETDSSLGLTYTHYYI